VRFFFFDPSSPPAARFDFTPFSSPGTGPDSRSAANSAGLGFLNVCKDMRHEYKSDSGNRSRENTRASAHNDMFGLVARLCEIQVMRQEVFLVGGSQANL
jgi:hypothetical protein